MGFSAIATVIARLFDCSIRVVEAQAVIFLATFIPANFTVIYLIPKKGLRFTLYIGAFLVALGAWLRTLVIWTGVFEWACIGSVFAAFGQTFYYSCTSKLASQWFGDKERTLSTSMSTLSLSLGGIVGFSLPALLITEEDLKV